MNPIEAIDAGILAKESKRPQGFPIRGSSTGACPRELFLKLAGAHQRPLDARTYRVFALGHARGEHLAEALREELGGKEGRKIILEHEVWTEIPYPKDGIRDLRVKVAEWVEAGTSTEYYSICGLDCPDDEKVLMRSRIDVLWEGKHEGTIIEIKTKAPYGFKKLDAEGVDPNYTLQVLCQARGLQQTWNLECTEAFVLYEDKSNQDLKCLPVDLSNPDKLDAALRGISELLQEWVSDGTDVPALRLLEAVGDGPGKLPWQCVYCAVGPLEGRCVPADRLKGTQRNGMTWWEVT